jgi:hypothetical protein
MWASSAAQRLMEVARVLKAAGRGVQTVDCVAARKYLTRSIIRRARRKGGLAASKFVALIHPLAELISRELRSLLHVRAVRRVAKSANFVSTPVMWTASFRTSSRAVQQQHQHVAGEKPTLLHILLLLAMLERKR